MDRLLPLAREYQIVSNERVWFLNACENAWSPVESGYQGWFVCALLGSLRFPNDWSVPQWAWFLTGHPNGLPGTDQDEDTIHAFLSGFAYTVTTYLLRRRQEAVAEVFLALGSSGSPTRTEGASTIAGDVTRLRKPLKSFPMGVAGEEREASLVEDDSIQEINGEPLRRGRVQSTHPESRAAQDSQLLPSTTRPFPANRLLQKEPCGTDLN
jgi:hypothetical protein